MYVRPNMIGILFVSDQNLDLDLGLDLNRHCLMLRPHHRLMSRQHHRLLALLALDL